MLRERRSLLGTHQQSWWFTNLNYFCGYIVGMSRPKKKQAERRQDVLRIRLTDAERKALDAAAAARTLDTSTWARAELLALAKRKA
jgi:hypothetical protein